MQRLWIVLVLCFLVESVLQRLHSQDFSLVRKAGIEKAVDSVFVAMIKVAERLDYDELATGVDDIYRAGFITNDTYYISFDSLLDDAKARSGGVAGQSIFIGRKKITVLSETIALATASGTATVRLTRGDAFDLHFYWSFVFEKINGIWKVIQSHQSGYR